VRYAFVELSTGDLLLGPPKSRGSRRIVGIPDAIIPALREHLSVYVANDPMALFFPGARGPFRPEARRRRFAMGDERSLLCEPPFAFGLAPEATG
jgi:integrase